MTAGWAILIVGLVGLLYLSPAFRRDFGLFVGWSIAVAFGLIALILLALFWRQIVEILIVGSLCVAVMMGLIWLRDNVPYGRFLIAALFGAGAGVAPFSDPKFPGDWTTTAAIVVSLLAFVFLATLYHLDLIFLGMGRAVVTLWRGLQQAVRP